MRRLKKICGAHNPTYWQTGMNALNASVGNVYNSMATNTTCPRNYFCKVAAIDFSNNQIYPFKLKRTSLAYELIGLLAY